MNSKHHPQVFGSGWNDNQGSILLKTWTDAQKVFLNDETPTMVNTGVFPKQKENGK